MSTSVSTVSGCVRASIAFFVFTTGIGHVSPIAFTVIIFIILPMLFQLVSPQNAGHAACQQIYISYDSLKSVHIYRHIASLNKSSHFFSRKPCGFKLVQNASASEAFTANSSPPEVCGSKSTSSIEKGIFFAKHTLSPTWFLLRWAAAVRKNSSAHRSAPVMTGMEIESISAVISSLTSHSDVLKS